MEKDYNVAGLPQTLENLEKHFFFQKVFENLEKIRDMF